jgi:outer membrane cobalamin receptor
VFRTDTSRTNVFNYDQLVNAGYAMVSALRGRFQLQGGVRVERATTEFTLATQIQKYDNDYNSIFPSALVAFNADEEHQVKLSYSTRIKRPDEVDVLDPTLHYFDPLNVSRGNPYLKPEYIRSLELGLQRTGERVTVQLTPFFRRTFDAVRLLRTIDGAGVATRTYANIATSDSYGGDATVALGGGRLTGFAGASAYRQVNNASNVSSVLSVRTFGWRARANAAYRVATGLDAQALFYLAQRGVPPEQARALLTRAFVADALERIGEDNVRETFLDEAAAWLGTAA